MSTSCTYSHIPVDITIANDKRNAALGNIFLDVRSVPQTREQSPMLQLNVSMPARRTRLLVASGFGLFAGVFCWYLMQHFHQGAGDFIWAIRAAGDLLDKRNPYATPGQLYPLPAALFGLPFVHLRPEIAGGIFYGISTALLALGITRRGYHHLLIFLAYPYWAGMLTVQWIPLIMASTFFWWLMPVAPAKPQIGLPVLLARSERNGILSCLGVIVISLLLMPHWPSLWLAETGKYIRFIPLLVLPGPLLLAALARYRDRDAWLLLLAACMPHRWFYDPFLLWLIPKTRRQIVFTVGLSWIPGIWRWYHTPRGVTEVGRLVVLCFYLPMLAVLLWPLKQRGIQQNSEAQSKTDFREPTAASEKDREDSGTKVPRQS